MVNCELDKSNNSIEEQTVLFSVSGVFNEELSQIAPDLSMLRLSRRLITVDNFDEVDNGLKEVKERVKELTTQVKVLTAKVNALMELIPKKFSTMIKE